jgi:hypothetical protein
MTNKEFSKLSYQDKIKYNLPAIIAFTNGEKIECKLSDEKGYFPTNLISFFEEYPYRVKPKTEKRWFNLYLKVNKTLIHGFGYFSKEIADENQYDNRVACVEIEVPVVS